jgi:uncharacterized protein
MLNNNYQRNIGVALLIACVFAGCPSKKVRTAEAPPVSTAVVDKTNLADGLKAYESGNYQGALTLLQPLADQGVAEAQNQLALMYQLGKGVAQDDKQAVAWFTKSAQKGYAEAQSHLGFMYFEGRGIRHDNHLAVEWYQKAADQGLASAQNHLGFMYHEGLGVKKDNRQAVDWYQKAADQGLASAQYHLGYMYGKGLGVKKDRTTALYWYGKAAEQGHDLAVLAVRRFSKSRY